MSHEDHHKHHFIHEIEKIPFFKLTSRLKEFLIDADFNCKASFYGMSEERIKGMISPMPLLEGRELSESEENQFRCMIAYFTSEINQAMVKGDKD